MPNFFASVSSNPAKSSVYLVLVITLLRLVVIGFPELTNDEAQYALYGYYLDWSYFDHPPLVGWLNAVVLTVSDSDFALRLWPVVLSILSAYFIYSLTQTLFPHLPKQLGFYAVALFQMPVILQTLGMVMLPDTPLIPVVLAVVLLLFKVCRDDARWAWLGLGLLFGLAGLSKYTAITIVPSVLLTLLLFKKFKLISTAWPWLAIGIAAFVVLPVVIWNVQHDWVSILYQLGHGMPDKQWQLKKMLESQLGQIIAFTPALFILGWLAMARAIFNVNSSVEQHPQTVFGIRYLALFALPVLLLFGFNGGYEHSLLHWTAVAWAVLIPAVTVELYLLWSKLWVRALTYLSIAYSVLMVLVLQSLLVFQWLPFDDNKHSLNDIYGWQHVALRASELRTEMLPDYPNAKIFIGNWSVFSRLAWYARPAPVVITDTRLGQSDLWYGAPQLGANGIVVVPPKYQEQAQVNGTAKFERCNVIETLQFKINNKIAASYPLYRCYNYQGI